MLRKMLRKITGKDGNYHITASIYTLRSDRCIEYQEKIGKVRRKLLCLQAQIEK